MSRSNGRDMDSATSCWECGRRSLSGVCRGPHDFGVEQWDRAIWRGNAERGPIRHNPPIRVRNRDDRELRYLEYLRRAAESRHKRSLVRAAS